MQLYLQYLNMVYSNNNISVTVVLVVASFCWACSVFAFSTGRSLFNTRISVLSYLILIFARAGHQREILLASLSKKEEHLKCLFPILVKHTVLEQNCKDIITC